MKLILEGCIMLTKLKSERIKARKAGDKLKMNILGVVIGQCDMIGVNINTNDVLEVLRRTMKSINERIEKEYSDDDLAMALAEAEILKEYLPKEIDDRVLTEMIEDLAHTFGQNKGAIMKEAKAILAAEGFPFNGKKVNEILGKLGR